MEESCLYGPLEEEGVSDDTLSAWISDGHEEEVQQVEGLIKEIERRDPQDERWLTVIHRIHEALENHIREEEDEIFPLVQEVWDRLQLAKAGDEMKKMKNERVDHPKGKKRVA
jgi:hypothetical protein